MRFAGADDGYDEAEAVVAGLPLDVHRFFP